MPPSPGGRLVLLLFVVGNIVAQQEVHQPPESKVVFLNQSAVFTCETVGGALSWIVNGTQREVIDPEIRRDLVISEETVNDGGSTEQNLTIPARAEYNGTRVQCVVLSPSGSDQSENATMIIQGPPSAVVDLKTTSNATSITISWEAPWSLDVTGVDHDIWYSVLIQNVTDENNPTPISCTDCTNITETVYTFTPDHLTPCHVYNFSVTPFNGAGQGESSHNEHQGISFERKNITYIGGGTCSVTFKVCGDSGMIYGVTLYYGSNEKAVSSISGGEVVSQLPADQEYNTTLGVELSQGGMQNVSTHIFTTFDVQDPQAESHADNHIGVEGTFIDDSNATGCFLAIQCNITTQITFIALERDGASITLSEVVEIPPSNYTVYAHDLEEDGLPNPRPANLHPDSLQPITVNGKGDYPKNANPSNASLSHTGSVVTITCTPEEGTSCLVVYRAYGNSTLNIYNKEFPAKISFDHSVPRNYTFAIFRKMNEDSIDRDPFISRMVTVGSVSPTSPGKDGEGTSSSSSAVAAGISVATVAIILAVASGIMVVVVVVRCKRKKTKRGDVESGYGDQNGGSTNIPHGSSTQPEEKEGKYAVVVTSSSGNRFPHSVDPTAVEYAKLDIRATHKMARRPYADVAPSTGNRPVIHDAKTEFPYVDVKLPNPTTTVTSPSAGFVEKETTEEKAKFQGPPTVEAVMSLIYCVAGRWKMIASGLGFNENLIDEIYTNNGTDEACLQDCVEKWVSRLGPSWERLSLVLRYLGEERLAQQAWNGVSAEEGAECSECSEESYGEGSHEVVTGTRGDTPFSVTRNDTTRGGKIHGNFSFGHVIVSFGDSTIREDQRKQEHTQSEDMGEVTEVAFVTFNGPTCIKKFHSFVEDDSDLFGSPVIEECPENQDFSVCPGHQNSSPAPHTAKDAEGNNSPGCTEGLPFRMVNCAQCTDMFPDERKHFSLDVQCERGTLLVGGKCNYTSSCQEPLSMVPEYLPFPGELPPEPTPPQEPAAVAVEETGENSPPPTQPPTLPPSSRMEVGGTAQTKNNTLPLWGHPENLEEVLQVGDALWYSSGIPGSSPIW